MRASDGLRGLGLRTSKVVYQLGGIGLFLVDVVWKGFQPPLRFRRLLGEVFDVGVLSLAIVCLSGLTVGAVLGLQGYNTRTRWEPWWVSRWCASSARC